MPTYNVHEAKTQLSRLLEQVEAGEEVVIARAGAPVARLVPAAPPAAEGPRLFGQWAGLGLGLPDDFDAWTPELEEMFFGEEADRKWESLIAPSPAAASDPDA